MSLSGCLKKLGKNVAAEDRAAIQSLAAEFRKSGMNARDAGAAAVRAQMDSLGEQHKALSAAPGEAAAGETAAGGEAQTLDQSLAQKIAAEHPDMQVTLPGSDERLTVADAMQRIAEEQKQDGQWADLVKVAAECFLSA